MLLQLSTYSAYQETSLYSRLDHEFPKTCVRKLFLRTLNTRSSFILLQVLDLLTTLTAFRVGGFEVNPLVASLTVHFGRVGGVVLSKRWGDLLECSGCGIARPAQALRAVISESSSDLGGVNVSVMNADGISARPVTTSGRVGGRPVWRP